MITIVPTSATTALISILPASHSLVMLLALIALLIPKEIVSGLGDERARRLSQALDVAIVPLIIIVLTNLAVRIANGLSS